MNREFISGVKITLLVCLVVTLFAPAAHAGPHLVCWPFDIGAARSLPWSGSSWHDARSDYDRKQLVTDTLALLTPDAPVLVRMETLRRAAIYAQKDSQIAQELSSRLAERADASRSSDKSYPLALFDWGYWLETYSQVVRIEQGSPLFRTKISGYQLIQRALALRGADAQMEFAAALVASTAGQRGAAEHHLQNAASGAADGSLLANNLVTHCHLFQMHAETLAALRSQLGPARN